MGDLTLVAGVILAALSVVELLSAWSESRSTFRGLAMGVLAGSLILGAHALIPGGVTLERIPMAFVYVVRSVTN
jgi:hypothetical protein